MGKKKNTDILFSIIVPVYNLDSCIKQNIQSLLNQTYKNIEIIIVDDASTDNSIKEIELLGESEKIRIIKNKNNLGLLHTRLVGTAKASGDYILFMDGDDSFTEESCQVLADWLDKNPCDVLEFAFTRIPEKTIEYPISAQGNRLEAMFITPSCSVTMWNKAYKASVIKNAFSTITPFYCTPAEDVFLSSIIATFTTDYQTCNKSLYNYNTGQGISTRQNTVQTNEVYFSSMKNVCQQLKKYFHKYNKEYIYVIPYIEKLLLDNAVKWFIQNKTYSGDIADSYLLLLKYFSEEALYPIFKDLISNAENYRTGKINFSRIAKNCIKAIIPRFIFTKLKKLIY
ncbi:MAG: glycosyltransferase family 2 protein [Treponema lecithinolyticum]|uniref:glycosyltransferase family 2 protein n=1 Tax=Treponema lecithinolyticum TaxID=53418 RepID=UPI003FA2FF8A